MTAKHTPLCLIARETGDVPSACLFNCQRPGECTAKADAEAAQRNRDFARLARRQNFGAHELPPRVKPK